VETGKGLATTSCHLIKDRNGKHFQGPPGYIYVHSNTYRKKLIGNVENTNSPAS
jgi:hypothetical protein